MHTRKYRIFLLLVLSGCAPWGVTEIDGMLEQKNYTVGNYHIQLNLHKVKRFVPIGVAEKQLWLWCQTDKTANHILSHQLNEVQQAAAFAKTGWQVFGVNSTVLTTIPDNLISIMFHEVNSEIAFGGDWGSRITFDSCATTVIVFPTEHFKDRFSGHGPGLEPSARPFFKKFTPTADNTGGCFDVEPLYLQDQSKLRQLCTTDKGKTWAEPPDAAAPVEKSSEETKS